MKNTTAAAVKKELKGYSNSEKAKFFPRFFKNGKGEYGEGDQFIGVIVPEQRMVAKKNIMLPYIEIQKLLDSPIHEHRLTALLILTYKYAKDDEKGQALTYHFYKKNFKRVNNWDLVDSSAHKIIGAYLYETGKKRDELYRYAKSKNLWTRRIAMVSTWYFIQKDDLKDVFKLAQVLLNDTEDLIQKAVGWMLREAGKKDQKQLEAFLEKNADRMPRTALRYSIEKLSSKKRQYYMKK